MKNKVAILVPKEFSQHIFRKKANFIIVVKFDNWNLTKSTTLKDF